MIIPEQLRDDAAQRRLVPFIGAGLSRPLGLPDWDTLIGLIAQELEMDPEICRLYGDYLQIAEFYSLKHSGLGKLRSKLDRLFNSDAIDIHGSQAHMLIPKLGAPAIYTTNWDNLIERAYDAQGLAYNKIVTVSDLVSAHPGLPNIVKYHGDFTRDDSLVLTETSYFSRMDLESPLDLRFRSDILGRTVLFLGYSFRDLNLRYLWYRLTGVLSDGSTGSGRRATAYIVLAKPNPVLEQVYRGRNIEIITLDPLDTVASVTMLIESLVREDV